MKRPDELINPAELPESKLLDRFLVTQNICFAVGGIIAMIILCGWLIPAIGSALPPNWSLMKANTALGFLLSIASLILSRPKRGKIPVLVGKICGVIIAVLAISALLGHLSGRTFWVDTLLAADSDAEMPGKMSLQTAAFFILIAPPLIFTKLPDYIPDVLIITAIVLVLMIMAGYLFNALHLYGQTPYTCASRQTLVCMVLFVVALVVHRVHSGFFFLLVGTGIGSQIARITLPWALFLPFVIIGVGDYLVAMDRLSLSYAAALTASTISILLFFIVLRMARKINGLELDLRDMSLTDEMTKIYNRRGFYLLGEYAFRDGQRNDISLTILYFDLDGLKKVNDTLGHDIGSELLVDFANLLRANFRRTDVVARLGGDEFAVLSRQTELKTPLQRLADATTAVNNTGNKPYQISYSVGEVTSRQTRKASFDELVARADAVMYEQKKRKKALQK